MDIMTIRVITEDEGFRSLEPVWNDTLQRCGKNNSIYLTYEWLSTWWKYFGQDKEMNILLFEKANRVIGILPLMKIKCKVALIKWNILETIGSLNYNCVWLVPHEYVDDAMTAFLAYIEDEMTRDRLLLRLSFIPEDSLFLDRLQKHASLSSRSMFIHKKVTTIAPYIKLPATWKEFISSLSRNRRKILRRALRALEKQGEIQLKEYNLDTLDDGLSKFYDLHQSRWQAVNIRGVFSNPQMKEFYRDIASQFLRNNWLYFTCLTLNKEPVSIEYSFIYNQKLYNTTIGRDILYSEYGVGHLHHFFIIKEAIKRHLQEVDLLRGDEPYKFHWTKSARRYIRIILKKRSYGSRLSLRFICLCLRLSEIFQYNLKEIYSLFLIKRREKKQKEKMGRNRLP